MNSAYRPNQDIVERSSNLPSSALFISSLARPCRVYRRRQPRRRRDAFAVQCTTPTKTSNNGIRCSFSTSPRYAYDTTTDGCCIAPWLLDGGRLYNPLCMGTYARPGRSAAGRKSKRLRVCRCYANAGCWNDNHMYQFRTRILPFHHHHPGTTTAAAATLR